MATAKKLPSGQWRTLVYSHTENNKRIYESFTSNSKKESEFLAAQFALNKRKTSKNYQDITFDKAIDKFIENNKNILSPSTLRGYRIMQRNCFSKLKNLLLKNITTELVQEQIYINSSQYAPKSISNQIGFISVICNNFNVDFDPKHIRRKPKENKEILIPTEEHINKILDIIKGTNIETTILLAINGLRQSEIAAAYWSSLDNGILKVKGAIVPDENNKLIEKPENKSFGSTRNLILIEYTAKRLEELKNRQISDKISVLIPSSVLRKFKKLCVANGLPSYTIHSLRHYHASLMLKLNVPDKYAMEILGQSSNHMLKRVYQHTFTNEFIAINDKINKHYNNNMQHEMQHTN